MSDKAHVGTREILRHSQVRLDFLFTDPAEKLHKLLYGLRISHFLNLDQKSHSVCLRAEDFIRIRRASGAQLLNDFSYTVICLNPRQPPRKREKRIAYLGTL